MIVNEMITRNNYTLDFTGSVTHLFEVVRYLAELWRYVMPPIVSVVVFSH